MRASYPYVVLLQDPLVLNGSLASFSNPLAG